MNATCGQRTVLGFDYGRRRIGVAVGQEITGTATELASLPAREGVPDWPALERLVQRWAPDALVVGVPYHMDGREHELTGQARRFARQLQGRFHLPVHEVDERLSSHEAEAIAAERRAAGHPRRIRKGDIDRLAARIIVEDWLRLQERRGE